MQKSRLLRLLRTFSESEIRSFEDFVFSPFHNKNERVRDLMVYLKGKYPDFTEAEVDRKVVFEVVYPGAPFRDLKIRHLMSMLLKLAESFLVLNRPGAMRWENQLSLLNEYQRRGLDRHFESTQKRIGEGLSKQPTRDENYFLSQYRLEMMREEFRVNRQVMDSGLVQISAHLDQFYLVNKLKHFCTQLVRKSILKEVQSLEMQTEILQHLDQKEYDTPLINLYKMALLMMSDREESKWFFEFKALLQQYDGVLMKETGQELHILARNYCIQAMNSGKTAFSRELFDLYRLALEGGFLQNDHGRIPPSAFKNIVSTSIKLQEFEWVEGFIDQFSSALDATHQSDYLEFSQARLAFAKEDFREALKLLGQLDYRELFIQADARVLLLKTYYELGEVEVLESLLMSFRKFIRRNKLLAYHRTNYLNIIELTRALIETNLFEPADRDKLKERILGIGVLTERGWLLSKLD